MEVKMGRKKKEYNFTVFQKFVEEMVRTETVVTNTGIFTVNGKDYILIAEIQDVSLKLNFLQKK